MQPALPRSQSHSRIRVLVPSKCMAGAGRVQEGRGGVGEEACSSPSRSSRLSSRVPCGGARRQKHPRCRVPALIKCILAAACPPHRSGQAKTQLRDPIPTPQTPRQSRSPAAELTPALVLVALVPVLRAAGGRAHVKLLHQHLLLPWYPHPGEKPQPSSTHPVLGKAERAPKSRAEAGQQSKSPPESEMEMGDSPAAPPPPGDGADMGTGPLSPCPRLAASCPGGSSAPSLCSLTAGHDTGQG